MKIQSVSKLLAAVCGIGLILSASAAGAKPPKGFTALFNGTDLSGWRGGDTYDHRKWLALPEAERSAKNAEWTADMRKHWSVEKGELVNDGHGKYATTEKDYGDFELVLEYKTVPKADSGIYLRGVPQVQIWDSTEKEKFNIGADKGSGGLWNNSPGAPGKDPLVKADKDFGKWNKYRVVMVGSRVSVWLNGKQVVDHAIMENYYDRKKPVPPKGPIQLQTHGGEIRWKNVFLREIGSDEANALLRAKSGKGFTSLFNGKNLDGWAGPLDNYEIKNGAIVCKEHKGGTIYAKEMFSDFKVRMDIQMTPGGNNGLAIRYPGSGDTAYVGMCELQVMDDSGAEKKYGKLDPRQFHGSAYGMAAAHLGYQRPVGDWNFQEVTVQGSKIIVELNGTVILNTDLAPITQFMANSPHPGKDRKEGYFGFAGHNDPIAFRNIEAMKLK